MNNNKQPSYIVVIGASAGSTKSVLELLAQPDAGIDAAFFVVLHMAVLAAARSFTVRLQEASGLLCKLGANGDIIEKGTVYVGSPGTHLVMKEGKIILGEGPTENRWRPSIDALFRSAAASYNSRVIGIILGGMLQDGTAGMQAIKGCGGTCVVQDPEEALYPDMIQSVMQHVEVDYTVSLECMGALLKEKTGLPLPHPVSVPSEISLEAGIAAHTMVDMEVLKEIGIHSIFSCPDCGGGLWEMKKDNLVRYRCHTGHTYTQNEYAFRQQNVLESSLWVALRMLEERRQLLDKMGKQERERGWMFSASQKEGRAKELRVHIESLKLLLFETKKD